MVARHHEQQRVGVGLRDREGDRGSGVARYRLDEQHLLAVAHLLAHHRDMAVAAQDDGRQEIGARGRALDGLAEQAALAVEQQELLGARRSEEHTSELQSTNAHLVCRLLLETTKTTVKTNTHLHALAYKTDR